MTTTPPDLETNLKAQDKLADDACAAVEEVFAKAGITLTDAQEFNLIDHLAFLVRASFPQN